MRFATVWRWLVRALWLGLAVGMVWASPAPLLMLATLLLLWGAWALLRRYPALLSVLLLAWLWPGDRPD